MSNVELMEAAVRANPTDETAVLALTDALIESGLSVEDAKRGAIGVLEAVVKNDRWDQTLCAALTNAEIALKGLSNKRAVQRANLMTSNGRRVCCRCGYKRRVWFRSCLLQFSSSQLKRTVSLCADCYDALTVGELLRYGCLSYSNFNPPTVLTIERGTLQRAGGTES